jgi:hypothetical protein
MKWIFMIGTVGVAAAGLSCTRHPATTPLPEPRIISHAEWEASPPLGYAADATRRNKAPGDSLSFHDLTINVTSAQNKVAHLKLRLGSEVEERDAREGSAFNWKQYHIAIVAVYAQGALGNGLTALEVATIKSLPPQIANSDSAGGAAMRLRIRHTITHITLHHEGDPNPLKPEDDVVRKLRALQSWSASDRNWWDVPYHFLLDLKGNIYEGRDYHYMGETNTTYDPSGHFLITVIGNYSKQQPTQAQIDAIADLMAWAVSEFDVPLDNIKGHYNYADTDCPGKYLKPYLENGTFRRMVQERLTRRRPTPLSPGR